jgi:uncharacterized FlgJ-related protein
MFGLAVIRLSGSLELYATAAKEHDWGGRSQLAVSTNNLKQQHCAWLGLHQGVYYIFFEKDNWS